tara:strand:+ start:11178 stop:11456 length:279 start_codon:yes stop_codon:yes gene_type:complete
MFVKLQVNKFYNLNEIRSVEIVPFDSLGTDLNRSYIAIYYVERHPDGELNDTLYYGDDCKHDNNQFRKDVEEIYRATHTKMWTADRQAFKFE